jgi:tRNA(fMet)-specific endonuclease VapC
MAYFLDTNIIIYFLNGKFPKLEDAVFSHSSKNIQVPSIVAAELFYGAEKSSRKKDTVAKVHLVLAPYEIVPFDQAAAERYGFLRADLDRKGTPVGPNDLVIAATVMSRGGILVTHNTKEFARIPGLMTEDWTACS